jgi:hypothetical protein
VTSEFPQGWVFPQLWPSCVLPVFQIISDISGSQCLGYEAVFWDVAACYLVEIDGRFRDAYCFHLQGIGFINSLTLYHCVSISIPLVTLVTFTEQVPACTLTRTASLAVLTNHRILISYFNLHISSLNNL